MNIRPDLSTLTSEQKGALILKLWDRLHKLEALLLKNGSNSSRAPSSDGFKRKPKSRRVAGQASPGGQKGHLGSTLKRVAVPDEVKLHRPPERGDGCGSKLDMRQATVQADDCQVIELPPVRMTVIEHRLQSVRCRCGKLDAGRYREALTQAVQYGPSIKDAVACLTHYQHVPMKRCTGAMLDLFGVAISPARVHAAIAAAHSAVTSIVPAPSESILQAPVVNFDETCMRLGKAMYRIHNASNEDTLVYQGHARRGYEALNTFKLLPRFNDVAVHDGWPSYYYCFNVTHALWNAHHLRDLELVVDSTGRQWAQDMTYLLVEINNAVDASASAVLTSRTAAACRCRYRRLLGHGREHNPERLTDPTRKDKRGGIKQSFARNLIRRLDEYTDDVLRFMRHALMPFPNNLAERDIRMPKLKPKVSRCYRFFADAPAYCSIHSYLGILQQRPVDLMQALTMLFAARMPSAG